ncbi:hypothetical protein Hanom_Chr12g01115131 [Helianthus anomalus]
MSLPWWDVEELPKVRTLSYPIRERDIPTWGLMKFETFKDFKHWKPHQPKKVRRVNPVTSNEETILQINKTQGDKEYSFAKNGARFSQRILMLAKDIECLFMNKIGFKAEDKEQAMQFQKIEKEEALKAEKERKTREEKDKMLRHTVVQRMAEEKKRVVEENAKLRKLLLKKPKQREEKFKSL